MKKFNKREAMGIATRATVACSGLLSGCKEKTMSTAKPKYQQYKNEDF